MGTFGLHLRIRCETSRWSRLARARPAAPKIIAYCAHVDTGLATAAEEAGADTVMPRSKFVAALPEILTGVPKTQSQSRDTGSG